MKKINKVHLEGGVAACTTKDAGASTLASVVLYTLFPVDGPGRPPSVRFGKMYHRVMVSARKGHDDGIRALGELFSNGMPKTPVCRSVDGTLVSGPDGESIIVCRGASFKEMSALSTSGNNTVRLCGKILKTNHTDHTATFSLDSGGESPSVVFIQKKSNFTAWDMIASGMLHEGSQVDLSGPLISREYTDGKTTIHNSVVIPREISSVRIEEKVGPKISF